MNCLELDEQQLDALGELTNIGASQAATALSKLLRTRVLLGVPSIRIIPLQKVGCLSGNPCSQVVAVYLRVTGETPGKAMFLFDYEDAQRIAIQLDSKPSQALHRDEMALSALKEVGNILIGSFLAAVAKLSKLKLNFSVPAIAVDMAGAIFEAVMLDGEFLENWVLIETQFRGNQIKGTLGYLPDPKSLPKLLGALGV